MSDVLNQSAGNRKPVIRNGVIHTDLCVLGAGSGGLSVAAGAVQMGASVVLIEKGLMGGDCLNTGCVPSKALIAAGHAAIGTATGKNFGVHAAGIDIRFNEVMAHVRSVIDAIAPHDSVERFEALGVTVLKGKGRFVSPRQMEVAGQNIIARRFVISTGSRAAVPPVPGLAEAGYLTNENIFEITERPQHLIIIGGGPIGIEMAQAFRRLGSCVTVIEKYGILAKDAPEAVEIVRQALLAEGVTLLEHVGIASVERTDGELSVVLEGNDSEGRIVKGSHILVAAGRKPNIEELGLEAAGIAFTPRGITVDRRLRTSNRKVFALGDVAGGPQFTHVAGYHAGIVIRNALFALPTRVHYEALPWVTYTDPELAHVGLTEVDARKAGHDVQLIMLPLSANDRAQAEKQTDGLIKVVLGRRGKILGATIVGPHAGDLIGPWGLAISTGLGIGAMANTVMPYPTLSELSKRVAGAYYMPRLISQGTRRLVRWVQHLLP